MDIMIQLKKIEPLIAIVILILLLSSVMLLYKDNKLKEEIAENCGFGKEDYYCFCEKGEADRIKNIINGGEFNFQGNITNVQLDR